LKKHGSSLWDIGANSIIKYSADWKKNPWKLNVLIFQLLEDFSGGILNSWRLFSAEDVL
jgi:hypothetical protein